MKINSNDLFWIVLIICFTAYTITVTYLDNKETIIALKNGYCQKIVDNQKIWVKDCK